jgi:hypothetical protein
MIRFISIVVVLVAASLIAVPDAWTQQPGTPGTGDKAPSASPGSRGTPPPSTISGEVISVDQNAGLVTVRMDDGTTQQFRGSKETISEYKVGDRIEGKLRR